MLERLSRHSAVRISQRNIRAEDIAFVMRFGRHLHNGGALFVFLGQRNIPDEYRTDDRIAKLEGTTLVVSNDGECLVTAYRNKKALRQMFCGSLRIRDGAAFLDQSHTGVKVLRR